MKLFIKRGGKLKDIKDLIESLRGEYGEVEAFKYCDLVFNSDQRVAIKTKQACARFIRDLVRDDIRYTYNKKESKKIGMLLTTLIDYETRKPFTPALFQYFIFQQMAWEDSEGLGRYRDFYISLARKQGKSLLVAYILIYQFLLGKYPEYNRQLYITSNTEDQAINMFDMIKDILRDLMKKDTKLGKVIKITKDEILDESTGSVIRTFANNPNSMDSYKPLVAVLDEYALMKNGERIYGALQTGMGMNKYGMMVMVSTVSDNLNSAMYKDYLYITDLLDGKVKDDEYFAFVAELEDESEIEDERNWVKANPLLLEEGFKERAYRNLKRTVDKARNSNKKAMDIITYKNFNIWGKSTSTRYLDYWGWEGASLDYYRKYRKKVRIGVDLSERSDLTSVSFVFADDEFIYIDTHSFVADMTPEGSKKHSALEVKSGTDQFDYIKASEEGHVTISEGLISYREVWEYIEDYIRDYELEVEGIYYDRYNINAFVKSYLYDGIGDNLLSYLVEVPQNFMNLSEPIKEFRSNLQEGRLKHSNNSVMNYCVKNATLREYQGQYLIEKPASDLKIDALAATINAFKPLVGHQFEEIVDQTSIEGFLDDLRSGNFSF